MSTKPLLAAEKTSPRAFCRAELSSSSKAEAAYGARGDSGTCSPQKVPSTSTHPFSLFFSLPHQGAACKGPAPSRSPWRCLPGDAGLGVPHLTGFCCWDAGSGVGTEKPSGVQGLPVNLRQAKLLLVTHASGVRRR